MVAGARSGLIGGRGAFFGHLFPVWLAFKGGKGVATGLGVLLAISWNGRADRRRHLARGRGATRYSSLASLSRALPRRHFCSVGSRRKR